MRTPLALLTGALALAVLPSLAGAQRVGAAQRGPRGVPGSEFGGRGATTPQCARPPQCPGPAAPARPWAGPAGTSPSAPGPATPGAPAVPGAAAVPSTPAAPAVPLQVLPDPRFTATLTAAPEAEGSWLAWWALHGERYLERRTAPVSQGATTSGAVRPEVVHAEVLPALLAALDGSRSEALQRATMTALARLGGAPAEGAGPGAEQLARAFERRLASPRAETAEDAVLALGILGREADAVRLAALIEPEAAIGAGSAAERVPARLRSFAAYALGLVGRRTEREDVRRFVAQRLWSVARDPRASVRDVPVACVVAYGLVPLALGGADVGGDCDSPAHCREGQVHGLLDIVADDDWDVLVRAHALTAAARLAAADPAPLALRTEVVDAALRALRPHSRARREVRWSAVVALGAVADADSERVDGDARARLRDLVASGDDLVERQLARVALARAGARAGRGDDEPLAAADDVRRFLEKRLSRGVSRDEAWTALALGVHGHALAAAGHPARGETDAALLDGLADVSSPADAGAFALALGLRGARAAAPELRELVDDAAHADRRGFAALGLGLMEDRDALPRLAELAAASLGRPGLHVSASFARGLCGDVRNTPDLVAQLAAADTTLERATLAVSLGRMGDERAVDALVAVVADEDLPHEARAAAAHALGELGDPADAPWYRALVDDLNYPAAPGSLLGAFGVLDRR